MTVVLSDVQDALQKQQIFPFFQPIVELRTGRLCGFEVLARWSHPKKGYILPDGFIDVAERNGLIAGLTGQLLQKTFFAARVVPEDLFFTVNVSPSELCSGNLALQIRQTADQFGFRPERLIIEVTEAVVIEDAEAALITAAELRQIGCRLALDDFGTGHSSLTYLQRLPFSCLKIDRSFVMPMISERQSRKIVASVIGLCMNLAMDCVGEGVETAEQADLLLWLGCDMAQGWFYGRPEPAEDLPRLISADYSSARANHEVGDGSLHAPPTQRLAQLQAIYRGAPVGLGFLDMRQRYVSLNQKFADMAGGVPGLKCASG